MSLNQLTEAELAALNPGIRRTVTMLRAAGFNTVDSGDGVTRQFDCDIGVPYVHIAVGLAQDMVAESHRLLNLVQKIPSARVEASYSPHDGFAIVSLYGVSDEALP